MRNLLIVWLICVGCLRVSEVVKINLEDIDMTGKTINIKGKGMKKRKIHLNDEGVEFLKRYLFVRDMSEPNTEALFPSHNGTGRISDETIRAFLKKIGEKTGLEVHPHKFRHTGATMAYKNSKNIVAVQHLLGHENINTTMIYTHIEEENRKEMIDNSPLRKVFRK